MHKITSKVVNNGMTFFPREELNYSDPRDVNPSMLPSRRISTDDTMTFTQALAEFSAEYQTINSKFPLDYLEVIQNLSLINPDISQMIANTVLLGNTGHKVVIDADSESEKDAMLEELNSFSKSAFRCYGGVDGYVNASLAQIARTGAGSVEWIIDQDLGGIDRIVFVPVSTIRFLKDKESDEYMPHQKVNDITIGQQGLIPLNPDTYQYCAMTVLDSSPYAIPPVLAALDSIMIQREMFKNLKFISKKLGLLGFVTILLKAPTRMGAEKDSAYLSRCQTFLDEQSAKIKFNYRDGLAVGFQDNMTVQTTSLMGNAQGGAEMIKTVEEQVFSGLNSDPAMHGRSYSTTETYAGVVYEKMLAALTNYQRTSKQILEYGYGLHLTLKGFTYNSLYVEFEKSKSLADERDEGTYGQLLSNLKTLFSQGIISQDQFAQEAGYEAPFLAEPIPDPYLAAVTQPDQTQQQSKKLVFAFDRQTGKYSDKTTRKLAFTPAIQELDEEYDSEFEMLWSRLQEEYHTDCGCHMHAHLAAETAAVKQLKQFVNQYFRAVYPSMKSSRVAAVKAATSIIENFDFSTLDSEEFANQIVKELESTFSDFYSSSPAAESIRKSINRIYKFYRLADAEPFGGSFPIKPSFDQVDNQAVKFMRESDDFYFGRYLTNPESKKSLKNWLVDDYLQSGRSLRDKGELTAFKERFGTMVGDQDYKILRVVETSASRSRNWGNVLAVDQAGATELEITGPKDQITCKWCQAMVGKEFKVSPVVGNVKETMNRKPEDLPHLSPFLPGKINPELLKGTSAEQLVAQGIALPPYHPHCRHGFVVKSFD